MKTFKEFVNEADQLTGNVENHPMGDKGSVMLSYKGKKGKGGTSLRGQGDWRKITNAMDNHGVKRMTVYNDRKVKLPAFVLKIFDKVESMGYELDIIDRQNPSTG